MFTPVQFSCEKRWISADQITLKFHNHMREKSCIINGLHVIAAPPRGSQSEPLRTRRSGVRIPYGVPKHKAPPNGGALCFSVSVQRIRAHWPQNSKHFLSGADQAAKQVAKRQASQGFESLTARYDKGESRASRDQHPQLPQMVCDGDLQKQRIWYCLGPAAFAAQLRRRHTALHRHWAADDRKGDWGSREVDLTSFACFVLLYYGHAKMIWRMGRGKRFTHFELNTKRVVFVVILENQASHAHSGRDILGGLFENENKDTHALRPRSSFPVLA